MLAEIVELHKERLYQKDILRHLIGNSTQIENTFVKNTEPMCPMQNGF
jgi:hypothetical protein